MNMVFVNPESLSIISSDKEQFFWPYLLILALFSENKKMLKVNNRNTRNGFKICSKLTTERPERRECIVIKHISHLFLLFLLLTLNR